MVKHNNVIPNQHFKKKWQFRVKTWFNQPARKQRRRIARSEKAAKVFPRPVAGLLRPVVRGQTLRYNTKRRLGRGFSHEELKVFDPAAMAVLQEAGVPMKLARSIGIAVDHRRRNRSLESLQENAGRLKGYKANLVLFPRNSKKPKSGEATAEERGAAVQLEGKVLMALPRSKREVETVEITEEMQAERAYYKLRLERTNAKHVGMRAKRLAETQAEEKAKTK